MTLRSTHAIEKFGSHVVLGRGTPALWKWMQSIVLNGTKQSASVCGAEARRHATHRRKERTASDLSIAAAYPGPVLAC
ncbi:hypothetical protein C6341_g12584 [Phytophthora cactorum]|nr:hypothetical protein PC120_g16037 [Phytophthora cactorum]KAG3164703.1 hypothetical protein C6341_g12584 [Phytophthora cactorum]